MAYEKQRNRFFGRKMAICPRERLPQNKPNLRKAQMRINFYSQKGYENKCDWTLGESKPNQSQFKAKQSQFKPKTNPIQSQTKPIQTQTNPILAAQTRGSTKKYVCREAWQDGQIFCPCGYVSQPVLSLPGVGSGVRARTVFVRAVGVEWLPGPAGGDGVLLLFEQRQTRFG